MSDVSRNPKNPHLMSLVELMDSIGVPVTAVFISLGLYASNPEAFKDPSDSQNAPVYSRADPSNSQIAPVYSGVDAIRYHR